MSATPATQNQGEWEVVPRLPGKTTVDVTQYHACHETKLLRYRRLKRAQCATQCHECPACHAKPRGV